MEPNAPSRGHLRTKVRLIEGTRRGLVILCAAICLLGQAERGEASNRETPLVRAIKRVRPSVVNIHSQKTVSASDAGQSGRMSGMGTGVVVDERGYIVTNYHVIEDVSSIRVTLVDGSTYPADVVARDPETDLALLHIDAAGILPVMPFGRSDDLMHGETVVAIGNAFGYEHTITQGIISELHRDVRLSATQAYRDLIQTDASINPGNSGGPLINIDGEMIGLNVAIRAGAQGIGFAIPVNDVKRVLSTLMSTRRLRGIWHGIILDDSEDGSMMLVSNVEPGSPADRAGLRPGDQLLSVDGRAIHYPYDIERALLDKTARDEIALKVVRSESEEEIHLALAGAPGNSDSARQSDDRVWSLVGVRLSTYSGASELRRYSSDLRGGMLITSIRPGSPAEQAGLTSGDVLVGMHQFETLSDSHIRYILDLQRSESLDRLAFHVVRDGKMYRGWLNVGRR